MKLWYDQPATEWTEALPLGNGRLGAMVFGGVDSERFALNEDSLWAGPPVPWDNPEAAQYLPAARRAALEGNYSEADAICRKMQGTSTESYLPLGDLFLDFGAGISTTGYYRDLDIDRAITMVRYESQGMKFTRESFISAVDQVVVVRLTADKPGSLSFTARFACQLHHTTTAEAVTNRLTLTGQGPVYAAPSYVPDTNPIQYNDESGIKFAAICQIEISGDSKKTQESGGGLQIIDADSVMLLVSAATTFQAMDLPLSSDPVGKANRFLQAAIIYSVDELRERHITDHQNLFRRVQLDLGNLEGQETLTTTERIRQFPKSNDPELATLLFQYGRYLLITSSRPGTQPANLQGIWNQELRPPWSSNYTLNINAEMNYWPAESANLSECHFPLLQFIQKLAVNGEKTAQRHYNCAGWVAHHNSDLWGHTAPVGKGKDDPCWSNWPMGGAWLCQHLWEHYAFTRDESFLREQAWPTMRGAALFCLDWLLEDSAGNRVTAPSTSPEHKFYTKDGQLSAVSVATTMDMAIIRDLFTNCLEAAKTLNITDTLLDPIQAALPRLFPMQIGSRGQLLEFEKEFHDQDEHHRHISHLFGLYPGREITPIQTPEFAQAARRTLEIRGDAGTGWSLGWKINFWARLGDGNHAYALVRALLTLVDTKDTNYSGGGGVYANLFDAHPPFQIDGNFAFTAGVIEMLLQSQNDELHLLPALPDIWPTGSVTGLRARGGFEVGLGWADGQLIKATITSTVATSCRIRYRDLITERTLVPGQTVNPFVSSG